MWFYFSCCPFRCIGSAKGGSFTHPWPPCWHLPSQLGPGSTCYYGRDSHLLPSTSHPSRSCFLWGSIEICLLLAALLGSHLVLRPWAVWVRPQPPRGQRNWGGPFLIYPSVAACHVWLVNCHGLKSDTCRFRHSVSDPPILQALRFRNSAIYLSPPHPLLSPYSSATAGRLWNRVVTGIWSDRFPWVYPWDAVDRRSASTERDLRIYSQPSRWTSAVNFASLNRLPHRLLSFSGGYEEEISAHAQKKQQRNSSFKIVKNVFLWESRRKHENPHRKTCACVS